MLVKVCGITRQQDLDVLNYFGVDFCGFIFHEKSPRFISPEKAESLDCGKLRKTGIFVRQNVFEIQTIMDKVKLDYLQLHGNQSPEFMANLPSARIIKVFWPDRYASLQDLEKDLQRFAPFCAFFLLDGGLSSGGHGKQFDWSRISELDSPRPWFIAGGLTAENIGAAARSLNARGIDLNSGVEDAPGIKNPQKIRDVLDTLHSCGFNLKEV